MLLMMVLGVMGLVMRLVVMRLVVMLLLLMWRIDVTHHVMGVYSVWLALDAEIVVRTHSALVPDATNGTLTSVTPHTRMHICGKEQSL